MGRRATRSVLPLAIAGSTHLDRLVVECARLADEVRDATRALLASGDAGRARLEAAIVDAHDAAARATLALDGADPDLAVGERAGTWFDALGEVASPSDAASEAAGAAVRDVDLAALERAGVDAALVADDLRAASVTEPRATWEELSRRLTAGLVAPERAGRLRTGARIVHDASVGRVLYHPLAPEDLEDGVTALAAWVADAAAAGVERALIAGAVHHGLLLLHPFDAANGRLARAAARLVLREGGLDPHGLAATEAGLARDALGLAEEVAATRRRNDLTVWLERVTEAHADALRDARARLGLTSKGAVPAAAREAIAERLARGEVAFTLVEHATARGLREDDRGRDGGLDAAREELEALIDARLVRRAIGGRGLRYEAWASPESQGSSAFA